MMMGASKPLIGGVLGLVGAGMLGLSFAAVPLYRMFCQATGFDGTPNTSSLQAPGSSAAAGVVEVRFDANTSPGLPWDFRADQRQMVTALGEEQLATYSGKNIGGRPITGVATYNVSPEKAAPYFHKTACFCFDEQTLAPGQATSFPISYWVDPAIRTNPATRDVRSITLSYTFFRSIDDAARNGGLDHAGPHVGARSETAQPLNAARF